MALKPDRKYDEGTSIRYFMNEVSERGIIVVFNPATTGDTSLDNPNSQVIVPTGNNQSPAGILLNDVVTGDPSRCCRNFHKDEVFVCSKVAVLRDGWVTTNMINAGDTPLAGETAYFVAGGLLSNGTGSAAVGQFLTSVDADGYVVVDITVGS